MGDLTGCFATCVHGRAHYPWNGPGRLVSANVNFTQLISYSPRLVLVTQPQSSVSNRPPNVYQRYGDEVLRHRIGTRTCLPNPKVPRGRHLSGTRKGNYNPGTGDNHGDGERNWNVNSKSRASGRSHSCSQTDKSNSS